MDTKYLDRRGSRWHCVVYVPTALRPILGKKLSVSLRTESLRVAQERRHAVVYQFKRQIAEARRRQNGGDEWLDDAMRWRRDFLQASDKIPPADPDDPNAERWSHREILRGMIEDEANEIEQDDGWDAAKLYYDVATGEGTLVSDALERWLGEEAENYRRQTVQQHRSVFRSFLEWSGPTSLTSTASRKKAGEFVGRLRSSGLKPKTVNRYISHLSSGWEWFVRKGLAENNVWLRQSVKVGKTSDERNALTTDQLVTLLSSSWPTSKYGPLMHDLVRLGLLTGARLDELCSLRREDVLSGSDGHTISIVEGKTENAIRTVPIHPLGEPIIRRRLTEPPGAPEDDWLFPALVPGGPDRKRSWNVSKAYGRFREQAGVAERHADFHALRHNFAEALEAAGVVRDTRELLMGHKREGVTFVYSTGRGVDLRAAIEKLDYGPEVMALIGDSETR